MLAKAQSGRKQPGSWIGDSIYGVNDGLGVLSSASSRRQRRNYGRPSPDSHYVLLAGISGSSPLPSSEGSGAYLAAKSEREIYLAEIAREREAIQMNGPEARETALALLPGEGPARGGRPEHGQPHRQRPGAVAPRTGIGTARTSEEALANPLVSAGSGALSTALGAAIRLFPSSFYRD